MNNIELKLIKPIAISNCNKEMQKRDEINSFTHTLEIYKEILLSTKKLANELNLTNSLELCVLYTYLLWNGYFSKDKTLMHKNSGRIVIPGMYAQDIMSGIGTCLNFSDMLTDFLNEFNLDSATLISILNYKIRFNSNINIKRNIQGTQNSNNRSKLPLSKKITGTHALNLIKENNKYYIYDPSNLCAFIIRNKKNAINISDKGKIPLKPYTSYSYNFSDKAINLLSDFEKTKNFESPYSNKEFEETFVQCLNLFNNNSLLNDYYDEVKDKILKIYNTNDKYYLDINDIIRTK